MKNQNKKMLEQAGILPPFPESWIRSDPRKVEEFLSGMSVAEQARCVMQVRGRLRQDLLLLSPRAVEVARALPPEEVYYMVKEIGEPDCLPILSAISQAQLQYIFDLEWWRGDKFLPQRVGDWLALLEKCSEPKILHWLLDEDLDQVVAALQALIKVYKNDEMTDSYEGVEGLKKFSPDGIYDVFFKIPEIAPALSKFLQILCENHPNDFFTLMEAVIWFPVSPTLEKAYRWRLTRTAERGIPEFEEAHEIYSRLSPEALQVKPAPPESFSDDGRYRVSPHYPVVQADAECFFRRCLLLVRNEARLDAIRWELVYLANKVMVADLRTPSDPRAQNEVVQKVMATVSIGLELGSGNDTRKGAALLENTWMQPLFQVGYGHLMNLKWQAEKLIKEHGPFLDRLLNENERDYLCALVTYRVPMVREDWTEGKGEPQARHFESLQETRGAETFLRRLRFYVRFCKQCLNVTASDLDEILAACRYPAHPEDVNLLVLSATALARYAMFREVACRPLPPVAARTFLELIFLPRIVKEEPGKCDDDIVRAFHEKLLDTPLAWTEEDKKFLQGLIAQCVQNLENQFGRIDLKSGINWKFTAGLCVGSE